MDELLDVLREHLRRYPQMTALDQVKLIYQNEFGPGHFILDEQASLERLEEEFNSLQQAETVANLFENIGNGLVRLNLRALGDVLPLATVNRFFTLTAHEKRGCVERFESKLEILKEHFSGVDLDAYLEEYKNSGYPAVSHSEQYKKHYAPSYRLISSHFALYFPVFKQIEKLLREKECIIVAIDGRSGSGKSFLAGLLQAVYGSPIISMDHFFLRPEQRTAQRLQEPGGNVDYERFKEEVTLRLREREAFNYWIYDCQTNTFTDSPLIIPHALTIVEGSYSHHPSLVEDYDLRVFLSVPVEVQRERILRRNGAAMWERFENEWIPLEELYFSTLKIKEKSHIKLGVDSNGSQGSNT